MMTKKKPLNFKQTAELIQLLTLPTSPICKTGPGGRSGNGKGPGVVLALLASHMFSFQSLSNFPGNEMCAGKKVILMLVAV